MTRIVALSSGVGEPSTTRLLADRLAAAAGTALGGASIEVVNLRELAHEITDAALTGFAAPRLQHVYDQVGEADALIVVVPTFKASYPGLFKSFIDALDNDALIGKVVLLGATGGTARHSMVIDFALRPLFAYLQAVVVPTGVFASPHDWGSSGEGTLQSRIERAAGELTSLLGGQGSGRSKNDEIDLFSETMLSISQPD
ncbi:NAD(P)H-dependent oxidoreductase [Aeromicrobium senzhongii]|uniref:NAD(P)H-dependent oxidoreductase n=1 Tax=Aeromicrobium senzhongii TaxID=2663859 RepID=A0ABX6SSZ9_9ACTN|nr:CE1759 family FMN reductase [Aeromicrobium senzhongii]MTB88502.1 NADPH-dependent FMN reductase [Aeromicrobium senzhongii]QNL94538.1 NAD(P)H-dependent oxidoreductase [Aeromicrobium senzhongii]